MSKSGIPKIRVSKEEFKKIKKGKQTLVVRLNNEENQKIKSNGKIIFQAKIDRFKKKIREIHTYQTLDELINSVKKEQLGYKKNDIPNYNKLVEYYKKEDVKKYGLLGIELKPKKHIFRKVLLVILIFILLFFSIHFINNKISDMKAKKIHNTINELSKERTDYVFIEINPYFVLTIKNNKVTDVACLNEDCISIYDDINIEGKNINESIDSLYNLAESKGYDISNGIKVKITGNIKIEDKDYITVEQINETTKNELLTNVINNEDIKNNGNDDYYSDLWNELKKDSDYDKVYTCKMNDNELGCYLTEEFITSGNDITLYNLVNKLPMILELNDTMFRTLNKFGVNYTTDRVNILGISYTNLDYIYINGNPYSWGTYISGTTIYYDDVLICDENPSITILVPITRFNLLTSQYDDKDAIMIDE